MREESLAGARAPSRSSGCLRKVAPNKLRRFLRSALPVLALALAALPAATPYLSADLPRTNDALPHLYRTLALDRLMRAGVLWPRWSPDLVHGFGYPVFNFFPILSHASVELFHLAGLSLPTAYRAAVVSQFILAAWFAYLLARDLFGPASGWVAALAYVYSPYLLYDAHVRAGLPQGAALAFLPLLLLSLRRAACQGGGWIAGLALAFAAAILSHYPIVYQFLFPIGLMLLWTGWRQGWRTLWRPAVGLGLGALLTSFFWLPALVEAQYVRTDVSIAQGYNYTRNFLSVGDLFAWPRLPADPALLNPPVVRALPAVALAWAVVALVGRWRKLDAETRAQVGLWFVVLVLSTFLVTAASKPIWDLFPLLKLTLYPWRSLGMASLAGALLAAAPLADLAGPAPNPNPNPSPKGALRRGALRRGALRSSQRVTLAALMGVTSLFLIGAIPWLYPPRESVPESPTLGHLVAFEHPPLFIGTTTLGEFLPRCVREMPDTQEMRRQLVGGGTVDRLDVGSSAGVSARQLSQDPLGGARYRVQVAAPTTLTYRQFYFPGWRATLDGEPLDLRPSDPHCLLEFDLPAGEHTLNLTFGSTAPRRLGWALSGLGALMTLALLVAQRQKPGSSPPPTRWAYQSPIHQSTKYQSTNLPLYHLLLLAALPLALKLFFDHVDTPLRRPTLRAERQDEALGPARLVDVVGLVESTPIDLVGELRLLGYAQSSLEMLADGAVQLTLYWQPLHDIGVVYDVAVQLIRLGDENRLIWSQGDAQRPFDWRYAPGTDQWPLGTYVMDPYILRLLDGAPPGEYAFHVGLVRHDTGQTVAELTVGHLKVTRPGRGDHPLQAGMKAPSAPFKAGGLSLLGSQADRREAAPGDPVRVSLLWQVTDDDVPFDDASLTLRLVTIDGETLVEAQLPVAGDYPPARWRSGDRLRTEALLRLPARTPDGEHLWQVVLNERTAEVGALRTSSPERNFEVPVVSHPVGADFAAQVRLVGADLPAGPIVPGDSLPVALVWQGIREMSISYHVFLHLIGPGGELVTQSDGVPAGWGRPTTGWLPGEVVRDERALNLPAGLPAGEYELRAGLYDPTTGERLALDDGRTFVTWTLQVNPGIPQ